MERREVFQFKQTISIPRDKFIERVVCNNRLTRNDIQVCLLLLTQLDGWDVTRFIERSSVNDPFNFKAIDIKMISNVLNIKKKEVKESIKTLLDEEILEAGDNMTAVAGYRFTF